MEKNRLLKGGRLLTGAFCHCSHRLNVSANHNIHRRPGYVPGAEALSSVKDLAARLRERNPDLVYLLDRVFSPRLNTTDMLRWPICSCTR